MSTRVGIQSVLAHAGWAGAAAVLLLLSFAPLGWGWLAHVALVPAGILALRSTSGKRLAWVSYLVGWAWWLWMIRWMVPVTGGGYALLAAYMAVYFSAALLLVRWLDRKFHPSCVLSLPMAWVSLELVRGYILAGGFGWYMLAHSQAPYRPEHEAGRIIQIADIFGEGGVSFMVAMTNGLLIDLLTRPLVKRVHPVSGRRHVSRTIRAGLLLWLCAYFIVGFYGQWRISEFDDVTRPGPVVAVVQTNIPQSNKDTTAPDEQQREWEHLIELTRGAMADEPHPELIVWPETIVPAALNAQTVGRYESLVEFYGTVTETELSASKQAAYFRELAAEYGIPLAQLPGHMTQLYRQLAEYHEQLRELAQQSGAALLVGAGAEVDQRRYNSAYLYHADGEQDAARYDKMHRVPFGEFIPWVGERSKLKQWFIEYLTPYDFDYTLDAGVTWTVFEVGHGGPEAETSSAPVRIVTPICFEDTIARVCRRLIYDADGGKRADVLVNLTNDGWFAGSGEPWQHLQIAVYRSIENRVPSVRSVNTGVSGFIDSVGRVGPLVEVAGESTEVEGTAWHALRLDERRTVFGRLGQISGAILIVATVVLALVGLFRRDKGGKGLGPRA